MLADLLADLDAESVGLDALVADLPPDAWARPTPAVGWSVAMQIAHLNWTDQIARLAAADPEAFTAALPEMAANIDGYVDRAAADRASVPPAELLDEWRAGRRALAAALTAAESADPAAKLPWFGPPMRPTSMATARLMETWAHGQDVADALGARRVPTARLRHVSHIGVRTRDFAYALRDRTPPAEPFRVEITGPDGDVWTWGPDDARQRVTGPALDFCLLVTQRRHRADVDVTVTGADADEWLDIAQAFAGPPGRDVNQERSDEAWPRTGDVAGVSRRTGANS